MLVYNVSLLSVLSVFVSVHGRGVHFGALCTRRRKRMGFLLLPFDNPLADARSRVWVLLSTTSARPCGTKFTCLCIVHVYKNVIVILYTKASL